MADSGSPRRASGTFSKLMDQKKRHSVDESHNARRLSHSEMTAKPGFIGSMWNNLVKPGHSAANTTTSANTTTKVGPMKKQSIHRTGAGTLG